MFNAIRKALLKWHKQKVLTEVRADLLFIRTFKDQQLHFDETEARMQLANLRRDEKLDENVRARRIGEIEELINRSNAVRGEYEKSQRLEKDLVDYISIL